MILFCPKCKEHKAWAGHCEPGKEPAHDCGTRMEIKDKMPEPEVEICQGCGRGFNYYGGRQLCWQCRRK